MPSDERKQVGPAPLGHQSMRQDAVSFAESFEAVLLSSSPISTKSIPSSYGSLVIAPPLIVTGVVHLRSP